MALRSHSLFRHAYLALTIAAASVLLLLAQSDESRTAAAPAQRQPVLVELFTSEGCSDCPPADELLAQLDQKQFVAGAQAIVLSEHVTYWNHQGWSDPFSFDAIDGRQQNYAQLFGLGSVYTPQMVVDGAAEFVGSDAAKLNRTVARAAAKPKLALAIGDAHRSADGSVVFSVRAAARGEATLVAALAENATRSEVARGENAGRTLHHVAVVRVLKDFGSGATDGRPLQLSGAGLSAAEKDGEPLRLVVFLVDRSSGHVVAVAEQTLGR
jgi:hypothetical protein